LSKLEATLHFTTVSRSHPAEAGQASFSHGWRQSE
jgi:hypothetical protein